MRATGPEPRSGAVEPELAGELPGLGLVWMAVEGRPGRSPRELKKRLAGLADRYTGGKVVNMRQDDVPWAYRVFARKVGIDPDVQRTPVEALALERLRHGGMRSRNLVDDALTVAIAETGVPVIALDAGKVEGEPRLRLSRPGERMGSRPLSDRQIVIADAEKPLAIVLGEVSEEAGVTPRTERMLLCALLVKGVAPGAAEEALWLASEWLE